MALLTVVAPFGVGVVAVLITMVAIVIYGPVFVLWFGRHGVQQPPLLKQQVHELLVSLWVDESILLLYYCITEVCCGVCVCVCLHVRVCVCVRALCVMYIKYK